MSTSKPKSAVVLAVSGMIAWGWNLNGCSQEQPKGSEIAPKPATFASQLNPAEATAPRYAMGMSITLESGVGCTGVSRYPDPYLPGLSSVGHGTSIRSGSNEYELSFNVD